ncbi:hypothetical protein PoB_004189900 [Plakobranchus ocellatus]|uniref:Uncharacterized protein n=1 Tax=Plakobranchus ocellatus TaxID=259542 RepID=A0AAV4B5L6_9GAST|nr:hypothetical protein PoB_004189900 [Plakobranchus ocellatus]
MVIKTTARGEGQASEELVLYGDWSRWRSPSVLWQSMSKQVYHGISNNRLLFTVWAEAMAASAVWAERLARGIRRGVFSFLSLGLLHSV